MRKNPHAVALGKRGGSANTKAQNAARAANALKGGRPRTRERCARCEAAKRTCYHR